MCLPEFGLQGILIVSQRVVLLFSELRVEDEAATVINNSYVETIFPFTKPVS